MLEKTSEKETTTPSIKVGDAVTLKGDINSPIMTVTEISWKDNTFVVVTWFNTATNSFNSYDFPIDALSIVF